MGMTGMERQLSLLPEEDCRRVSDAPGSAIREMAKSEFAGREAAERVAEWNSLVEEANLLKERIGVIHDLMREDERRPSQYEHDYRMLWYQYMQVIYRLRQIDSQGVDSFREKVVSRVKELEVRLNTMCDAWNPDDFEEFERMLALYEKLYDQAEALA